MQYKLIDMVLEQIREDVQNGDMYAIDELLRHIPEVYLHGYLSEEKQFQLYEMENPR